MPAEGEVDEEESGEAAAVPVVEVALMCYRWISTLKSSPDAPPRDKMLLSFSVPISLLPVPFQTSRDGDGNVMMMTPEQHQHQHQQQSKPRALAVCDVDGCTATRSMGIRK